MEGAKSVVVEVGCGGGNTLFPLIETNKDKFVYAFDCADTAIALLKVCQPLHRLSSLSEKPSIQ